MATPERRYQIRRATADNVEPLAAGMASAFYDDPQLQWIFPDADSRVGAATKLYRAHLRWGLVRGKVFTTEHIEGCAVWVPGNARITANFARAYLELSKNFPRIVDAEDAFRPDTTEPYAHLTSISAFRQSEGIGSALLRHGLANLDHYGIPIFLEASTERSRNLYARFGFREIGTVALANGGPAYYPMWCEPQSTHL